MDCGGLNVGKELGAPLEAGWGVILTGFGRTESILDRNVDGDELL